MWKNHNRNWLWFLAALSATIIVFCLSMIASWRSGSWPAYLYCGQWLFVMLTIVSFVRFYFSGKKLRRREDLKGIGAYEMLPKRLRRFTSLIFGFMTILVSLVLIRLWGGSTFVSKNILWLFLGAVVAGIYLVFRGLGVLGPSGALERVIGSFISGGFMTKDAFREIAQGFVVDAIKSAEGSSKPKQMDTTRPFLPELNSKRDRDDLMRTASRETPRQQFLRERAGQGTHNAPDCPEKKGAREQSVEDKQDNLKIIEGIGPKSEAALNASGIARFAQVAQMTPEELEYIVKDLHGVCLVGSTVTWPRQARLAASGKFSTLEKLQARIRHGFIFDDLTEIEGIDPFVQDVLNRAGIRCFEDLVAVRLDKLVEILEDAGIDNVEPTAWQLQARLLSIASELDAADVILRDS